MRYTKTVDYALHTVAAMMEDGREGNAAIEVLAAEVGIGRPYLSKILAMLAKAGIVASAPGRNGGYRLQEGWEDITFLEVIRAVDGEEEFASPVCRSESCRIRDAMEEAERRSEDYLGSLRIADVVGASH